MTLPPRYAAQVDWRTVGAFTPEQFAGDERKEYEDESRRIQQQWDNQPN